MANLTGWQGRSAFAALARLAAKDLIYYRLSPLLVIKMGSWPQEHSKPPSSIVVPLLRWSGELGDTFYCMSTLHRVSCGFSVHAAAFIDTFI